METNPLRFLKPHKKQRTFLSSPARVRFFLGGNQSGKTTGGWMDGIANAYGYRFWEVPDLELAGRGFQDLPRRENVPSKYWVKNAKGNYITVPNTGFIVTGLAARRGIGETIWEKFQEIWPKSCKVYPRYMMAGVPASMQFPNGSRVIFGSGEQQELSTEGVVIHWAWVDEPIPQRVYIGLWRGLIKNYGRISFTLTPLKAKAAWIYNYFISPNRESQKDLSISHIEVTMRDNPHLDKKAIEEFENDPSLSESERQARLYGKFQHLESRVWPQFFNGPPFVCEPFAIPEDWDRMCIVDPHTARPWAIIWAAISPSGVFYIYREWPEEEYVQITSSDMTFSDYAYLIRKLEGKENIRWRVMDPNYGVQHRKKMGWVERSIQEEIADYGLHFDVLVDDSLLRGIDVIANMFNYDKSRAIGPDNGPKIVIFDNCLNVKSSISNLAYVESKNVYRRTEKISEEFKDFADTVRYMGVYERPMLSDSFSYFEESEEEEFDED
jgi:phage terminase large subunit-like protein